jgi:hypothetical protein
MEHAMYQVGKNFLLEGKVMCAMQAGGHIRANNNFPMMESQDVRGGRVLGKLKV